MISAAGRCAVAVSIVAAISTLPVRASFIGAIPLDGLLGQADAVVEVRVETVVLPYSYDSPQEFHAEVVDVLSGGDAVPERLVLHSSAWPEDLGVAFEPGARVIAFLERDGDRFDVINNTRAILPAGEPELRFEGAGDLRLRVFAELASVLRRTPEDATRAQLLVLLSEIATGAEEPTFVQYLGDAAPWTRRGALAALLSIHPTPERVALADEEVRAHLGHPPAKPDQYFFRSLFGEVLLDRLVLSDEAPARWWPFLPIFRTIADAKDPLGFEEVAIQGLRHAGDRSDALRLWRYATGGNEYQRRDALDALSRLFLLGLRRPTVVWDQGRVTPEAVAQERRMHDEVRAALEREGLLPRAAPR